MSKSRHINALSWRLRDRRAPFPGRLAQALTKMLASDKPCAMVSVGLAAVERPIIEAWRAVGVPCLHYSTDDPWNPSLRARWHFDALQAYDIVFTPRRAQPGRACRAALQAGRLPSVWLRPTSAYAAHGRSAGVSARPCPEQLPEPIRRTCLFVGGADESRVQFIRQFIDGGGDVALVGGYWERWPDLKHRWLGHLPPHDVLALTQSANLNLILVRRANRDGHTMRTFEAGAIGGCLLVEDTPEHRDIFGADGETVRFFSTATEAAATHRELVRQEQERLRLAQAVAARIRNGHHTYGDRLRTMVTAIATHNATQMRSCP